MATAIRIHRLAVAATVLSSSSPSRCIVSVIGSSGAAASDLVVGSSVNILFGGAPALFISTWATTTWHRTPHTNHRYIRKSRNISPNMQSMPSAASPPTTWSDLLTCDAHQEQPWSTYAHNLFPPLASTSHKGSHGRIAILGGSEKYTGAPYYAAQSSLHCGVDLVSIYCATEACIPIKCYSPELMVQGVYSIEQLNKLQKEGKEIADELEKCKQKNKVTNNEITERELQQTMKKLELSEDHAQKDRMETLSERLTKIQLLEEKWSDWKVKEGVHTTDIVNAITSNFITLHALCIGPGLGRHPLVFSIVEKVIYKAIECHLMLVLDADVLYMLSLKEYQTVLKELTQYELCVMTPNLMEMRRLHDAFSSTGIESSKNILVQKGHADTISYARKTIMRCKEEGGLKRSGGIGDVLAGAITAFMAWNAIIEKVEYGVAADSAADGLNSQVEQWQQKQRLFAVWTAATLVKKATKLAYDKKRRSMSAINVIDEISNVLNGMEDELTRI